MLRYGLLHLRTPAAYDGPQSERWKYSDARRARETEENESEQHNRCECEQARRLPAARKQNPGCKAQRSNQHRNAAQPQSLHGWLMVHPMACSADCLHGKRYLSFR